MDSMLKVSLLSTIGVLMAFSLLAQTTSDTKNTSFGTLIEYAEKVYGPDDLLVNGSAYIPTHLQAAGHPYFLSDIWHKGSILSNGKHFSGVDFKFNLYKQELVMQAVGKSGAVTIITLNPHVLKAFELEGHYFINLGKGLSTSNGFSFYELVYEGSFVFVIHHKKIFNAHYSERTPYGSFSKPHKTYYLLNDTELFKLSSKRAFLNHFKTIKPALRKFMRQHKIKYKKADLNQLKQLMKYCDNEISRT